MKNRKLYIKIIIVLIFINISFLLIILNIKNKNIEEQEITKEQLGEVTTDNAYITLEAHNLEVNKKQNAIVFTTSPVNMKQYTDNWASLTNKDFKVGYTTTNISGKNGPNGAGPGSGQITCYSTYSYNQQTGSLSFSASSNNKTWGNYDSDNYTKVTGSPSGLFAIWLGTVNGQ